MIGEALSVVTILWQIQDFLSTAYRNSARCSKLRDCLDHQMPLFTSAIDSLDAQSLLMTRLDSFARSTLAFARTFERRNFIWKLLCSPKDNAEFDRILAELDSLQRDITFAILAELKEHTTRTTEAAVSILTNELRRLFAGAQLTDLKFDKRLLVEPHLTVELPQLTASDVVSIRDNIAMLRESSAEMSPEIVTVCEDLAGNVLLELETQLGVTRSACDAPLTLCVLVDEAAEENARIARIDVSGMNLVSEAREGHEDNVKALLAAGSDVNQKDRSGYTPLHKAAGKGHESVVALLLTRGADIMAQDNSGYTPLHEAARCGCESVVALLLTRGADIMAQNSADYTPLHMAAWYGFESVVALLLTRGADIMAQDRDGDTPLHMAALCGHESVVALLLTRGADITAQNREGQTPLDLAVQNNRTSTVALLRSHKQHA